MIGRWTSWTAVRSGQLLGAADGTEPYRPATLGSKRHLICDARGVPLAIQLTGANRNDSQQALALVDAIPSLQGERGRPRHRPDCVMGDRGYDAESIRQGSARKTHHPSSYEAQHRAWQRIEAMAMGGRTDFRLAESIPATAGALRKAHGHSRGILVLGVCSDLLELPASRLGGELKLSIVPR